MPMIKIKNTDKIIQCSKGENLLDVLLSEGIFVDNPCGGKGICGKCKVKVEEEILLSCMVEIQENMEVELLQRERKHKVLTEGYIPAFEKDSYCSGYGIAVDIGTTTVVTALIDLVSGEEIANASMINAQKHYGLDVLTRITYEYEHKEEGIKKLQDVLVHSMNGMIEEVCREANIQKEKIVGIHIAANCTMLHMLLGVDARSIGRAPYEPQFVESKDMYAREIGIHAGEETRLYCLPSVSAYIGADIVAGAYVCQLHKEKRNVLFIDIGTNGEIVLASKDKIWCCSCAAGPALEGMNISCGMRAAEGAIEAVDIKESGVRLQTIGNTEPIGICGSGILSVIKELLRTGLVKESGVFVKKDKIKLWDYRYPMIQLDGTKRQFVLSDKHKLLVTQGDVRQVQLAKGAILSGFTALLQKAGLAMEELDQVMIAGQFGAHLPVESLTGIGILPAEVEDKIIYVGNSSKTGAYMTLLSQKAKEQVESLAKKMEYMELAETKNYERIFTESMMFPRL